MENLEPSKTYFELLNDRARHNFLIKVILLLIIFLAMLISHLLGDIPMLAFFVFFIPTWFGIAVFTFYIFQRRVTDYRCPRCGVMMNAFFPGSRNWQHAKYANSAKPFTEFGLVNCPSCNLDLTSIPAEVDKSTLTWDKS